MDDKNVSAPPAPTSLIRVADYFIGVLFCSVRYDAMSLEKRSSSAAASAEEVYSAKNSNAAMTFMS